MPPNESAPSPPSGAPRELTCRCCVVGGGPAGMMLGLLLARAGIDVVVIEKHADFFRDFRGDTIHPSTLEALNDLGLLDEFLTLPHQEARELGLMVGDVSIPLADFRGLPTRAKFIALMPQWDFLDFLARKAAGYPQFRLLMRAEAVGLIFEGERVAGVRTRLGDRPLSIRADLTFACDGRHSRTRAEAGFAPQVIGAPMDVLWFRLPRHPDDPAGLAGRLRSGQMLVLIDRGDYWQCAYVIAKGSLDALQAAGLSSFRERVATLAPFLVDRVAQLSSFDELRLLSVAVDRLRTWHRPGLLCIGDAAHAMSPIGGVGVNLAIQDAIAAANLLCGPLRSQPRPPDECLARVQTRREAAVKATQRMQVLIQNKVISRVLSGAPLSPPWFLCLFKVAPILRRLPGRLIGLGVRPERVRSPAAPGADAPGRKVRFTP